MPIEVDWFDWFDRGRGWRGCFASSEHHLQHCSLFANSLHVFSSEMDATATVYSTIKPGATWEETEAVKSIKLC